MSNKTNSYRAVFLSFALLSFSTLAAIPQIEVLIGRSLPQIVVKGENLTKTYLSVDQRKSITKETKTYPGKNTLVLNCGTSLKDKWQKGMLVAELSSSSGIIEWKNEIFKGDLNIIRKPQEHACHIVQALSLEHYLSTLLGKEMNKSWPLEALKAQAVAARSYALYKMRLRKEKSSTESFYDLESSEKDQVNGSLADINSNTIKATFQTEGEVLVSKSGKMDPIFYHAQCGGQTNLPQEVWHERVPDYRRVKCGFCQTTKDGQWKRDFSSNFFLTSLKLKGKTLLRIADTSKYASTVRLYFRSGMQEVEKSDLRRLLGKSIIRSNNFQLKLVNRRILVTGQGLGHGVGLCQLGALALAKKGWNYQQILNYYYPQYHISKIYGPTFGSL